MALAHKILRKQIVLAAMQLLMSRPELRRSFKKLGKPEENEETALHAGLLSTGNVFSLAAALVPDHLALKKRFEY